MALTPQTGKLAAALLLAALGTLPATAKADTLVTATQNGQLTLTGPDGFATTIAATRGADPAPAGSTQALVFDLQSPPDLVTGDVLVTNAAGTAVELIRFEDSAGSCTTGCLLLYSANHDGNAADLGLPTAYQSNLATVSLSSDGSLSYTPSATQPGYVSVGISYAVPAEVPEPSALVPLCVGLIGLAVLSRRGKTL